MKIQRVAFVIICLSLAYVIIQLSGCDRMDSTNPMFTAPEGGSVMKIAMQVATDLGIDGGEITISKGDLVFSQPLVFEEGQVTVVFSGLQPGIWLIVVALWDEDGFVLYEGDGEAEVHGNETTTAHIVLTELTGELEVIIELPSTAEVLFEDHFTDGMLPEWVSVKSAQWVEDGWLLSQADGSYGRDSYAFVHDGDITWTDYEMRLVVDPLPGPGDSERGDVFFRTSEIEPTYYCPAGNFYRFHMICREDAPNDPGEIWLGRKIAGFDDYTVLYDGPAQLTSDPLDVLITLSGPRIRISIDGTQVIDLIDSYPLLSGGVGVGTTWECLYRFDNIVVTSAPTPTK